MIISLSIEIVSICDSFQVVKPLHFEDAGILGDPSCEIGDIDICEESVKAEIAECTQLYDETFCPRFNGYLALKHEVEFF